MWTCYTRGIWKVERVDLVQHRYSIHTHAHTHTQTTQHAAIFITAQFTLLERSREKFWHCIYQYSIQTFLSKGFAHLAKFFTDASFLCNSMLNFPRKKINCCKLQTDSIANNCYSRLYAPNCCSIERDAARDKLFCLSPTD